MNIQQKKKNSSKCLEYSLLLINEADQITAKSRSTLYSEQLLMTSIELNSLLPVKQPWHREAEAGSSGAGIQFRLRKLSRDTLTIMRCADFTH